MNEWFWCFPVELMLLVSLFFVPVENVCLLVVSIDNDRQLKLCISLGSWDIYLITFADIWLKNDIQSSCFVHIISSDCVARYQFSLHQPSILSTSLHFPWYGLSQLHQAHSLHLITGQFYKNGILSPKFYST